MSTRELLIQEINHASEDVLLRLLRYLQIELKRANGTLQATRPTTTGAYADYWNQFIGIFADEEWERPPQDKLEQRLEW